jgi:succinate-semialdehyde dehydrogenase/glutarate-semialdehyde dehydrogenase
VIPQPEDPTSLLGGSRVSSARLASLAARVPATGSETLTVRAPAVDEPLGVVPVCTVDDVEQAVERARTAEAEWERTPPDERAAVVDRLGDLVLDHRAPLLDLLQLETGKSRRHGVEETLEVPLTCTYYAERGPGFLADEERDGALAEVVPALVAGNAVVLKPDEKTPFRAYVERLVAYFAHIPRWATTR